MELARSASPTTYMHTDEPPMLVVHGTGDRLVPYNQAELLVEAMGEKIYLLPSHVEIRCSSKKLSLPEIEAFYH